MAYEYDVFCIIFFIQLEFRVAQALQLSDRVIIQISRIAWIVVFTNTKLIEGAAYCCKCLRVAFINFLTGENTILQAYIIQYSDGIISLVAVTRFKNAELFRWIMAFIPPQTPHFIKLM